MTLYDSVISNLKAVIGSRKDGVALAFLDAEYESMAGEKFPLRQLGYNTLYDFIKSHYDQFKMEGVGRYCRIQNVVGKGEGDTTLDLINLIQSTKTKYKGHSFPTSFRPRHSSYQFTYQNNFVNYNPPLRFQQPYNYNEMMTNPFNMRFSLPSNTYEPNMQYREFSVKPTIELKSSNINQDTKKSSLIVPRQVSAKVTAEKSNILVISDEDDCTSITRPEIGTQTLQKEFKSNKKTFCTFQSLEFVNLIIDLIIEFKQLKYNDVIKIKVDGDLYFHFRQLTGISIDPALFSDYVLHAVDSPKVQYIYKNLIYLDPHKSHCLFNIKSTYKTKNRLPEFEFDFGKEYFVEIVKTFHDNLIAFKISNKLNPILDWKKTVTSEQSKEIIESQQFWSWIPGSLCLIQLPYSTVTKLNLSSVERAIIISTDIAELNNGEIRNGQPYIIHSTSFYLIDHEMEIEKLLTCASSYQEVKIKAKERNNTDVTFVCNMSICAMNTPSKIQFTKLENFKEVSETFLNEDNQLKPNTMIILKNIKKMTLIFHFQSMYSSFSSIYTVKDKPQEVLQETKVSTESLTYHNNYATKDTMVDYSDIIVLSDDEDCVISEIPFPKLQQPSDSVLQQSLPSQSKIDIKSLIFNNAGPKHPFVSSYLEKASNNPVTADSSIVTVIESSNNKMVKIGGDRTLLKTTQPFYSEKIAFKIASTNADSSSLKTNRFSESNSKTQQRITDRGHIAGNTQSLFSEKVAFKIVPPRTLYDNTNWRLNESLDARNPNRELSPSEKFSIPQSSSYEHVSTQISSTKEKVNGFNCVTKESMESNNHLHSNGLSSTSYSQKKNNETISIVSYSGSEGVPESLNSLTNDSNKSRNDVTLPTSIITYLENNVNPSRKCLRPLTTDMINSFSGKVVKLMHVQTGSAVIMLLDSVKLMRREIKMMTLRKQNLQKVQKISVGDFYICRKGSDIADNDDFILVEIMQVVSEESALTNNVHQGLLSVVNINDLFCLPEDKNGDIYGSIQNLVGPSIGAFDLHMFPDWFTPDDQLNYSNELFTAYFVDGGKLVLEYFEDPCKFLNIEIIPAIEKSLIVNHCNVKAAHFIEMLSKDLLQCRLYIGNILEMVSYEDVLFNSFSITKALRQVTLNDSCDVWFASVVTTKVGGKTDCYSKLSPHNFMDDQFCIDRVIYDGRKHSLHLLEHQNVNIEVPDNFEGLYTFDKNEVTGSLKGNEEFYSRYMLAGGAGIPDLKYLHNKLIFDIRAF